MLINRSNLATLGVAFNTAFQAGLSQGESQWPTIATAVPSTTGKEEYGWLGKIPNVREWLGDRVIQNISQGKYAISNKDYEVTIGVDRNDIEDDNIGIYGPLFTELGRSSTANYDQLVWGLLKAGFATNCYDGQYFFDTDHPVLDANGVEQSVANTDGGSGEGWYLVDDSRALKPLILQKRKDWQLVAKDKLDDENVFNKKQFIYGVDARHNVGYGFWQFAWGSKQTLDVAHYNAARAALMGMKGDYARPLGLMPRTLIVGPSNEAAGRAIVEAQINAAGASNVYYQTAKLVVVPWLA
ncbi:MAG TPA: Mu-like prophage major head subunit gpT family protein [Kaistia sp.]|nr:Mu-like prophage major head subunit gpT family protein [Kaistia sp.]